MRWLFVCSSGLQFLSAIALVEEEKKRDGALEVDLILLRSRREILRIEEVIPKFQVFRKIFVLDDGDVASLKHVFQNPKNFVPRLLGAFKSGRPLARKIQFGPQLPLDFVNYTDFFVAIEKDVSIWIASNLSKHCRIHQFEDGIGTYLPSVLPAGIEDFCLFEPELSNCPVEKTRRIAKLSPDNLTVRKTVSALCGCNPVNLPPVLYVDQYWGANTLRSKHASEQQQAMWKRRIELIDAVIQEEGIDRSGILIHPGSKPVETDFLRKRYGENAVIDLNGIPFEAFLLNGARCPEKIYTVSSSAAFYWKIACEVPASTKMIFLVRSFQFDYRGLTIMPAILEKLRQRYPDLVEIR